MTATILRRSPVLAVKRNAFGEGWKWLLTPEGVKRYPLNSTKARQVESKAAEAEIEGAET